MAYKRGEAAVISVAVVFVRVGCVGWGVVGQGWEVSDFAPVTVLGRGRPAPDKALQELVYKLTEVLAQLRLLDDVCVACFAWA